MTAPFYSDDWCTLYLGDCREITEWLAADVLVTDPPYGIDWEQSAYLAKGKSAGQRTKQHDGIQNDGDVAVRDEALRLWGDLRPGLIFGAIERPAPAGTRRTLVWEKPKDAGLFGSTIWRKDWEPIFMVGKWPQVPATESSIVRTAAGSHRQYAQGLHPHGKPLDTLRYLIRFTEGTIADPFAGSGSTLRAAKDLGRKAVGVELEERYCEVIAKRLAQGVLDFGEGGQSIGADDAFTTDAALDGFPVCGACEGRALAMGLPGVVALLDMTKTGLIFEPDCVRAFKRPVRCPGSNNGFLLLPAGVPAVDVGKCAACGVLAPIRVGREYSHPARVLKLHDAGAGLVDPCEVHAWDDLILDGEIAVCRCKRDGR